MATAKHKRVKPVKPKVVLTLTQKEADTVRSALGSISGSDVTDRVWDALVDVTEFIPGFNLTRNLTVEIGD